MYASTADDLFEDDKPKTPLRPDHIQEGWKLSDADMQAFEKMQPSAKARAAKDSKGKASEVIDVAPTTSGKNINVYALMYKIKPEVVS